MRLQKPILAVLIVLALVVNGSGEAFASPLSPGGSKTAASDSGGLELEWSIPAPVITTLPDHTLQISVAGLEALSEPGQPQLPFLSSLVAIPPDSNPTVEILEVQNQKTVLTGSLAVQPESSGVSILPDGQALGGMPFDSRVASETHQQVEIETLGKMRGVNLARVTVYPVLPVNGEMQVVSYIKIRVSFNAPLQPDVPSDDPMIGEIQKMVVNPDQIQVSLPDSAAVYSQMDASTDATSRVAIEVDHEGVYKISYEDLAGMGFPVGQVDPRNFHLTRDGQDIPYQWTGDQDAIFEAGEYLLFYAQPRFSRWTDRDVYWLSVGSTAGTKWTSRAALSTSGLTAGKVWADTLFESNELYMPDCNCAPLPQSRNGDAWVWSRLSQPGETSGSYPFALSNVQTGQTAQITIWLLGFTESSVNPDHKVAAAINGKSVGTIQWDGKNAKESTLTVPANTLINGDNTLTLTLPGITGVTAEGAWLDSFSIRYLQGSALISGMAAFSARETGTFAYQLHLSSTSGLKVLDVTQPDSPVLLTNIVLSGNTVSFGETVATAPNRYILVPSSAIQTPAAIRFPKSLKTGAVKGANYVIIAPEAFVPALSSLIQLRQSQGLTVVQENLQAIYDAYGQGLPVPEAIRDYLKNTYAKWSPAPSYVLLVGDGTIDPRRYQSSSFVTYLPPFLADVDPFTGEIAADNRFVTLDGGDDNLPDMMIGRLPVNSLQETTDVVTKLIQYEAIPDNGWMSRAFFVSDRQDISGNFSASLARLSKNISIPPMQLDRLFLGVSPLTADEMKSAIITDWNRGASLVVYDGHSSVHQWSADELFHISKIPLLNNGYQLPFVMQLTCFTGSFQMSGLSSMDELLLRYPQGGAVAVWGSTGLGISSGHESLGRGFLQSLSVDGNRISGKAIMGGILNLVVTSPGNLYLIDNYILFGDPATRLRIDAGPYSNISLPYILGGAQ